MKQTEEKEKKKSCIQDNEENFLSQDLSRQIWNLVRALRLFYFWRFEISQNLIIQRAFFRVDSLTFSLTEQRKV